MLDIYKDIIKTMTDVYDVDLETSDNPDDIIEQRSLMDSIIEVCNSIEEISDAEFTNDTRKFLIRHIATSYNEGYVPGLVCFFRMFFKIFDKYSFEFRDIFTEDFYKELKSNTAIANSSMDEELRNINMLAQEEFARDYFYGKCGVAYHESEAFELEDKYPDTEFFMIEVKDLRRFITIYYNSSFSPYTPDIPEFDEDGLFDYIFEYMNEVASVNEKDIDQLDVEEMACMSLNTLKIIQKSAYRYVID